MIEEKRREDVIASLSTKAYAVLELGCGPNKRIKNAVTVDIVDMEGVDIVADLSQGLPFLPDSCIDAIYSFHFLEHLPDINFFMNEVHRVLKKDGLFCGTVPHFSNPHYYSDPTHKTFFGLYTFAYYAKEKYFKRNTPVFYNDVNFVIGKIRLHFYSQFYIRRQVKKLYQKVFNCSKYMQEFFEEIISPWIPASELYFELKKK